MREDIKTHIARMEHYIDTARELAGRQLAPYARSQRRAMLMMSAVVIAMSWGGLYPTEVNVPGITFAPLNASALLGFAIAIQVYLLLSFGFNAKPEFTIWSDDLQQWSNQHELISGPYRLGLYHSLYRQANQMKYSGPLRDLPHV